LTIRKVEADSKPSLAVFTYVRDRGPVEGSELEVTVTLCWRITQVDSKFQFYTDVWSTTYDFKAETLAQLKARVANAYKILQAQDTSKAGMIFELSRTSMP
jgi:hypothetical protein